MRRDPKLNMNAGGKGLKYGEGKRGRVKTSTDPYIDEAGMPEPASCDSCGAVYLNKRWYVNMEAAPLTQSEIKHTTTCPGCRKVKEGYAEGFVELSGGYLWQHEEEIRNIIKNEVQKAKDKNPLEKIIFIKREGDSLLIETTEEKLAEHLGRAINNAHQGELQVTWTEDHSRCRVSWNREV